jgi:hypothetical protein
MDSLIETVKQRASSQLTSQKGRATDSLTAIAGAVRQSTAQLRADQHEGLAEYVERAADHLERFSNGLRDKSADELMRDVRQMARRQPTLFIGGSFAVGLLAARFFKSSGDRQSRRFEPDGQGYGGPTAAGTPYYGAVGSTPSAEIPRRDFVSDTDSDSIGTLNRERL